METLKLYMILLGCKPPGRNTEQHDLFFGIAGSLPELKEDLFDFWPEANRRLHIDAWREVTQVGAHTIRVAPRTDDPSTGPKLFFINLGGYKREEFEEFHYKLLSVAEDKGDAIRQAKETAFYKHTGFKGATSHVDDKYGVDVDDIYEISDILPPRFKSQYRVEIQNGAQGQEDEWHLGYLKMEKL